MHPILWKLLCGAIGSAAIAGGVYAGLQWHQAAKEAKKAGSSYERQVDYLDFLLRTGKINKEHYDKAKASL